MANIAESMFSQHYQSDGLMMASYSATSGGAVGGILGCGSNGGGGGMDSHPPNAGRGRIFSIDLDREFVLIYVCTICIECLLSVYAQSCSNSQQQQQPQFWSL